MQTLTSLPDSGHPWNGDTIRRLERLSIRTFMEEHRGFLTGKVLDFGAGASPYRDLVSGEYFNYDLPAPGEDTAAPDIMRDAPFDSIMCNQVLQYVEDCQSLLRAFSCELLKPNGYLLLTYATNWDEVEPTDLCRYTRAGMERLLDGADFQVLEHDRRAEINLGGFRFPLGYGVVARSLDRSFLGESKDSRAARLNDPHPMDPIHEEALV